MISSQDHASFKEWIKFDSFTKIWLTIAIIFISGKILVHCREGRSRSASLVLAYLMKERHLTLQDATRTVRFKREICPNEGFLQQLCNLNDKLTEQGHFAEKTDS